MDANQAMLIVAEQAAKDFGFIEVSKHRIDAERDLFWGNKMIGIESRLKSGKPVIVDACKYIIPQFEEDRDKNKRTPRIQIDMHWGKPRLGIDLPNGTSCFVLVIHSSRLRRQSSRFSPTQQNNSPSGVR